MGRNRIARHETGEQNGDPLPPVRQTAGKRPGRRGPYRVQMPPLRGVHHPAGHAPRSCRPWSLSSGGTVATKRRPYHPPALSDWLPPLAGPPGYIMGETGPQGFGAADFQSIFRLKRFTFQPIRPVVSRITFFKGEALYSPVSRPLSESVKSPPACFQPRRCPPPGDPSLKGGLYFPHVR